jgi:hypothetical protein
MKKLTLLLIMSIPAGIAAAQDLTVCASKGYTLTSDADAVGEGLVTYQWLENNLPVPDSNSPTLTVAAGHAAGDFAYVRVAATAACTLSSNTYTVRVNAAPTITHNDSGGDVSQTVNLGTAISAISYTASNSATFTMTGSFPTGVTGNANGSSYTISGTPSATGTFGYSLTAAVGSCTSAAAVGTITVNEAAITPPGAASTQTWVFGGLIWSDVIVEEPTACAGTSSLSTADPPPAQYLTVTPRTYYNWTCMSAATATMCPPPWRVPSASDAQLVINMEEQSVVYAAWAPGALGGGFIRGSELISPQINAMWTTSTGGNYFFGVAQFFANGGGLYVRGIRTKNEGLQVRGVKE